MCRTKLVSFHSELRTTFDDDMAATDRYYFQLATLNIVVFLLVRTNSFLRATAAGVAHISYKRCRLSVCLSVLHTRDNNTVLRLAENKKYYAERLNEVQRDIPRCGK